MRVYVTSFGWVLSRRALGLIAALVSIMLAASLTSAPIASAEEKQEDASESAEEGADDDAISRPDRVSAALAARTLDKRVLIESETTETDQVFANPDGSLAVESYADPARVQDTDGSWRDIDLTLEEVDGGFAPVAAPVSSFFSDGGDKTFAELKDIEGKDLNWQWPDALPAPTVDGSTLTYADVVDNGDLIVNVLPGGFSHSIVLRGPPAEGDEPLQIPIRVGLDGASISAANDGSISVTAGSKELVTAPAPLMWDAAENEIGDPANLAPVEAEVEKTGSKTDLVLTPDADILNNPDTEYPVTIDPSYVAYSPGSVWVQTGGSSTDAYRNNPELRVGTNNGGSLKARSYLKFADGAGTWAGSQIVSAKLRLRNFSAVECGNTSISVNRITQAWSGYDVTWANQPSVTTSNQVDKSQAAFGGPSGCSTEGFHEWDIKNIVQLWANNPAAYNFGLRLKTVSETDSGSWRKYRSTYYTGGTIASQPRIDVVVDSAPPVPTSLSVNPSTSTGDTLWSSSNKPKISVPLTEPESQLVKAQIVIKQGSTTAADFNTPTVAAGATATATAPAALTDGTYTVQTRAIDSAGNASPYTTAQTLRIDTAAPAKPTVTCSGYNSNTWYDTRPSGTTSCTVTDSSDGTALDWTRNGRAQDRVLVSGTSTSLGNFTIPANGVFGLAVKAVDAAGNASPAGEFGFGTGDAGMTSPVSGERTSSTVTINASAPEGATWARVERKSEVDSSWTEVSSVKPKGSLVGWSHLPVSADDGSVTTGDLVWDMSAEEALTAPSTQQIRVCFVYSGATRCTTDRPVTLVPSAFGGSFPTQTAGPGQVALFTGEFGVDENDVSVPGYGGDLSLGRSHRTFDADKSVAASVFGPGWTADLSGPDAGEAGMDVVDNTTDEAAISLLAPDGSTSTYIHEDDTASPQRVGFYEGDAETGTDNDVLEIEDRSGTKYLRLTEEDDTVTEWKHLGSGMWATEKVIEPFDQSTTTFTHDSGGRVTGIYAPAPSGVTCTATSQTEGCRALQLTYTGTGGATRLSQVDLRVWDPVPASDGTPSASKAMTTKTVARYSYDTSGRLQAAWDPRLGDGASALKTSYEYDTGAGGQVRLTKATPPGETAWRFAYDGAGRFSTAKRSHPAAVDTGDATWTVTYDTALSGSGLPTLNAAAVASWGQPTVPTGAVTVFGPDAPGTSDYTYGVISYFDIEGRTTNTATYGAGAWHVDSTGYDAQGNEVWALDEGNRATALASDGDTVAVANTLATLTTYDTAGARVEKTLGPTRQVVLDNGSLISGRDLSTTVYDDEATAESVPTPGRPTPDPEQPATNLPVEERAGVADADGNTYDIKKTRYRYDPVSPGDGDGWTTGAATRTMAQLGSSWSTTLTRYDTDGKLLETRTPQGVAAVDGSANDTRSRKTVYYTADSSSPVAACRNSKAWVGLECQVGPAGQPSGTPLPATTAQAYDYLLSPTRVVEQSGSVSRTSVIAYDTAGRFAKARLAVSGAPSGDQPVADTTIAYSPTTGAPTAITAGAKTQTTTYDAWGRPLTQTDGNGNTGTTTYNTDGQVKMKRPRFPAASF